MVGISVPISLIAPTGVNTTQSVATLPKGSILTALSLQLASVGTGPVFVAGSMSDFEPGISGSGGKVAQVLLIGYIANTAAGTGNTGRVLHKQFNLPVPQISEAVNINITAINETGDNAEISGNVTYEIKEV